MSVLEDVQGGAYRNKGAVKLLYTEIKDSTRQTKHAFDQVISRLGAVSSVLMTSPGFITADGQYMGLSNKFYVQLRQPSDYPRLVALAEAYNIEVLGKNRFMPLWFTLSCNKKSMLNPIDAANLFYESNLFDNAEPEFILHNLLNGKITDDTYYADQWYLNNAGQNGGVVGIDINAEPAWSVTMGDGVGIAILDQGLQLNHPDLQANILGSGYDAQTFTAGSIVRGDHGTAVAGIAGAVQNTIGVSGVAPEAQLISISANINGSTYQMLASGINWAVQNGADIINNSWGGGTPSPIFDAAITDALNDGRNNLGAIIVFSSGNNNSATSNYPANSNPLILNVGAIDRCGMRSGRTDIITEGTPCDPWCATCNPGSAFGPTLDVVAGGSIISTTDRLSNLGYNPFNTLLGDYANLDYTRFFGGTSAAAPQVAGVAALILSVNPNLTVQEVSKIIELTAQKVRSDVYTYATTTGRPNGTWNQFTGHGLVDACRAVHEAYVSTNPLTGPSTLCSSETYTLTNLPAGATITGWSASPSGAVTLSGSGNSRTVTRVGSYNGQVTITATLNTACGSVNITRDVFVGFPSIECLAYSNSIEPVDGDFLCPWEVGAVTYLCSTHPDNKIQIKTEAPHSQYELQIRSYPSLTVLHTQTVMSKQATLSYTPTVPGWYNIRVRAISHPCGIGPWYEDDIEYKNCYNPLGGRYDWKIYPNPASETLTVSMGSEAERVAVPDKSLLPPFSAVLYDTQGRQLRQGEGRDGAVQFDTRQLPEGTYFLHILHDGQVEKRQVVITH